GLNSKHISVRKLMRLQELKEKVIARSREERLELQEAIAQSLKSNPEEKIWQYLEPRAESWRDQLYLKGKKLRASNVYFSMLTEKMTPEETADDWDLPIEAVLEAIEYCETHTELIDAEAEWERKALDQSGIGLKPETSGRQ
ncbi:MAG: hypothetical protein AAFY72_15080, partial [Cyanobacteria bacterium J06649_4]